MRETIILGEFDLGTTTRRVIIQGNFQSIQHTTNLETGNPTREYTNTGDILEDGLGATNRVAAPEDTRQSIEWIIDTTLDTIIEAKSAVGNRAYLYKGFYNNDTEAFEDIQPIYAGFISKFDYEDNTDTAVMIIAGLLSRSQGLITGGALQAHHNQQLASGIFGDGTNGTPNNTGVTDDFLNNASESFQHFRFGDFRYVDSVVERQVTGKVKTNIFGNHKNIYADVEVAPALQATQGVEITSSPNDYQSPLVYGTALVEPRLIDAWNPTVSTVASTYQMTRPVYRVLVPKGATVTRGNLISNGSGTLPVATYQTLYRGSVVPNLIWSVTSGACAAAYVGGSQFVNQGSGAVTATSIRISSDVRVQTGVTDVPINWRGDEVERDLEGINSSTRYGQLIYDIHTGTIDELVVSFDNLDGDSIDSRYYTFVRDPAQNNTTEQRQVIDEQGNTVAVIEVKFGDLQQTAPQNWVDVSRGRWTTTKRGIGHALVSVLLEATRSGPIQRFPDISFRVRNETVRGQTAPTQTLTQVNSFGSFNTVFGTRTSILENEMVVLDGVYRPGKPLVGVANNIEDTRSFLIHATSAVATNIRTHYGFNATGRQSETLANIEDTAGATVELRDVDSVNHRGRLLAVIQNPNNVSTENDIFEFVYNSHIDDAADRSEPLALRRVALRVYQTTETTADLAFTGSIQTNDAGYVIPDYLTNQQVGVGLEDSDIDLRTFRDARRDREMLPALINGTLQNRAQTVDYLADMSALSGIEVAQDRDKVRGLYRTIIDADNLAAQFTRANTVSISVDEVRDDDRYNEYTIETNRLVDQRNEPPTEEDSVFSAISDRTDATSFINQDNLRRKAGSLTLTLGTLFDLEDANNIISPDGDSRQESASIYEDYAQLRMEISRINDEITVVADIEVAHAINLYDICSVVVRDETRFMLVTEIEDRHNGTITITGVRHDNMLYDLANPESVNYEATQPTVAELIGSPQLPSPNAPVIITPTWDAETRRFTVTWNEPTQFPEFVAQYVVQERLFGDTEWRTVAEQPTGQDRTYSRFIVGSGETYQVRVQAQGTTFSGDSPFSEITNIRFDVSYGDNDPEVQDIPFTGTRSNILTGTSTTNEMTEFFVPTGFNSGFTGAATVTARSPSLGSTAPTVYSTTTQTTAAGTFHIGARPTGVTTGTVVATTPAITENLGTVTTTIDPASPTDGPLQTPAFVSSVISTAAARWSFDNSTATDATPDFGVVIGSDYDRPAAGSFIVTEINGTQTANHTLGAFALATISDISGNRSLTIALDADAGSDQPSLVTQLRGFDSTGVAWEFNRGAFGSLSGSGRISFHAVTYRRIILYSSVYSAISNPDFSSNQFEISIGGFPTLRQSGASFIHTEGITWSFSTASIEETTFYVGARPTGVTTGTVVGTSPDNEWAGTITVTSSGGDGALRSPAYSADSDPAIAYWAPHNTSETSTNPSIFIPIGDNFDQPSVGSFTITEVNGTQTAQPTTAFDSIVDLSSGAVRLTVSLTAPAGSDQPGLVTQIRGVDSAGIAWEFNRTGSLQAQNASRTIDFYALTYRRITAYNVRFTAEEDTKYLTSGTGRSTLTVIRPGLTNLLDIIETVSTAGNTWSFSATSQGPAQWSFDPDVNNAVFPDGTNSGETGTITSTAGQNAEDFLTAVRTQVIASGTTPDADVPNITATAVDAVTSPNGFAFTADLGTATPVSERLIYTSNSSRDALSITPIGGESVTGNTTTSLYTYNDYANREIVQLTGFTNDANLPDGVTVIDTLVGEGTDNVETPINFDVARFGNSLRHTATERGDVTGTFSVTVDHGPATGVERGNLSFQSANVVTEGLAIGMVTDAVYPTGTNTIGNYTAAVREERNFRAERPVIWTTPTAEPAVSTTVGDYTFLELV